MKDESNRAIRPVLWCVVGCVFFTNGCGGTSNGDTTPVADQLEVTMADGTNASITRHNGQPVSLELPDGRTIPLRGNEVAVDDQLVISSPTGRVEVHRIPNHVVDEMDRLPHLYLKEGSLEEHVTQGFRGEPHVGADGTLYWSARVCKNPNCASSSTPEGERPPVFINRLPGVWLADDGTLASANRVPGTLVNPCPACGSAKFIRQYVLPNTRQRRAELAAELAEVRAARAAAGRSQ